MTGRYDTIKTRHAVLYTSPQQTEISQAFKSALLVYASTSEEVNTKYFERVGELVICMTGNILVI